jgi:hypothetical protein
MAECRGLHRITKPLHYHCANPARRCFSTGWCAWQPECMSLKSRPNHRDQSCQRRCQSDREEPIIRSTPLRCAGCCAGQPPRRRTFETFQRSRRTRRHPRARTRRARYADRRRFRCTARGLGTLVLSVRATWAMVASSYSRFFITTPAIGGAARPVPPAEQGYASVPPSE